MKGKTVTVVLLAVIGMVTVAAMSFVIGNIIKANKLAKIANKVTVALRGMHESDVSYTVDSIRDCAENAGVTMAKLNLTEEAIQQILHQGYVSSTRKWIAILYERKCRENIDYAIEYAEKFANMADMTLIDFGLTDDVLKDLLRQGYVSEARKWMAIAEERKDDEDVSYAVGRAKKYAEKAGTTVNEI